MKCQQSNRTTHQNHGLESRNDEAGIEVGAMYGRSITISELVYETCNI